MKIAIVDGFSSGRHLNERLRSNGATTVHLRSQPSAHRDCEALFNAADYAHDLGYLDEPELITAKLRDLGVSRVVPGYEGGVSLADQLSENLGTPGNDPACLAARSDKHALASLLKDHGLNYVRGEAVSSGQEAARHFTDNALSTAMVKPLRSTASDQVYFCDSAQAAATAAEEILSSRNIFDQPNERALVQEEQLGEEYLVNTVSVEGRHTIVEIWKNVKSRSAYDTSVCDYAELAHEDSPAARAVGEYLLRALDVLGVRNAAAHSDIVLTRRGPVLLDFGARLGGCVLPWVSEKLLGNSHAAVFASAILNPDRMSSLSHLPLQSKQPLRHMTLVNHFPGTMLSTRWMERINRLPTVVTVNPTRAPGDDLVRTKNGETIPGFLYLASDSREAIEKDYAQIRQWEQTGLYTND
ncbi:hypothetical protein [Natronoglycomyces albus]|uniref:ATP-grasp domain-containing protein n=1 Tax=Natronoglycomyces albus TaxID=2811108 RepID=A0A895XYE7_9ACTN|nr:hypothetical protein [Natronoglycomyces albus]QSB06638.1 hypothetical protein JQS30_07015 [Natronoglycomyces albus]